MSLNRYLKNQTTRQNIVSYLNGYTQINGSNIAFDIPQRLFKYSGLKEYVVDNLERNSLTMADPSTFNDLYDASFHCNSLESFMNDELMKQDLLEMLGVSSFTIPDESRVASYAEHYDRFISQYIKQSIKVACLSADNQSILMWSHYASNNQGICIEYDLRAADVSPFMYPVIYADQPIDCSRLCNTHMDTFDVDLATLLSTIVKCNVWSYEKEWRIICNMPPVYVYNVVRFPVKMPKPAAIYLGNAFLKYWISNRNKGENINTFIRFCDYIQNNSIPIYVMKNAILSYHLYPREIDCNKLRRLDEDELYEEYIL